MITNFNVIKELFEDTERRMWHFEVCFDGKEYQGYYSDEEVKWFQMKPDQENHDISLEKLDTEVKERLDNWLADND